MIHFLCNKCDFIFRKGDTQLPCIVTVVELASGDMKNYLNLENPSDDELYSSLFQIMAGLHAIQMSSQILNNDIKSRNILYYNVQPGGYWHYKIDKNDFYVPNYGKLFVLNDFGVSTLYDPNFQLYPTKEKSTFNLGSRLGINIDGQFSPINTFIENKKSVKWIDSSNNILNTSNGVRYRIDRKTGQVITNNTILTSTQKSYLFRKGVTTNPNTWAFFEHPYIIPPFEFYNDIQDVLRTFVGGKRTTQRGNHTRYKSISDIFVSHIKPYMGLADNSLSRTFSIHSYHVLAGEFINKFFSNTQNYITKPNKSKIIDYYNMNKCFKPKQFY